jgi:hypothetical protein
VSGVWQRVVDPEQAWLRLIQASILGLFTLGSPYPVPLKVLLLALWAVLRTGAVVGLVTHGQPRPRDLAKHIDAQRKARERGF